MVYHNDDSSSEDGNIEEALREATDHDLLQNSLFNNDNSDDMPLTGGDIKPSARFHLRGSGNFERFGVSHNYKKFVARKLFKLLERKVKLLELVDIKEIKKKRKTKGIRLLISSAKLVVGLQEAAQSCALPARRKTIDEDFAMNMKKCKEVSVDSDFVIAGTETKMWCQKRNGTTFKYKKISDGTFIEQA